MKAIIQRVKSAKILANGVQAGQGGAGLFILLGVGQNDSELDAQLLASKIAKMRIFEDEVGKMGRALGDIDGTLYVVSNFTLYGECKKGNRPDFFAAAPAAQANALYERFLTLVQPLVPRMVCGVFGADMQIETVCDGPVTIVLESEKLKKD